MFLSITGVTSDNKLAKYQPFDSEAKADVHAAEYNGFVVVDPGGNDKLWTVDPIAKTVTRDVSVEQAAAKDRAFEELRRERNSKLADSDWWASSDLNISQEQTAYRQALRDLPANTDDSTDITWPEEPGS